jgi:hypothetical protein
MRQTEKIKIVLGSIYDKYLQHKSRVYYDLVEILNEADILTDASEAMNLGKRLEGDGYVHYQGSYGKSANPHIQLTTFGVEVCEDGSVFKAEAFAPPVEPMIELTTVKIIKEEKLHVAEPVPAKQARETLKEEFIHHDLIPLILEVQIAIKTSKEISIPFKAEILELTEELMLYLNSTHKIPRIGLITLLRYMEYFASTEKLIQGIDRFLN